MSEFSGPKDKPRVPPNDMGKRYKKLHPKAAAGKTWKPGQKADAQLKSAGRTADEVPKLVSDFVRSVGVLQKKYVPRKEPFHPRRRGEDAWMNNYIDEYVPGEEVTSHVAARARKFGFKLEGPGEVEYVDREIKPVRTTRGAEQPKGSGIDLRLDLLLAQGGRPIVAEVKCRGDENAYYALIQSLAAAAQLSSDLQRKRLTWAYGEGAPEEQRRVELSETKSLAVWIILCEHNSRGKAKGKMLELAEQISRDLMTIDEFNSRVSEIRCVGAKLGKTGKVALTNDLGDGRKGWRATK